MPRPSVAKLRALELAPRDAGDPVALGGIQRLARLLATTPDPQRRLPVDPVAGQLVAPVELLAREDLDVREKEGARRSEVRAELDVIRAAGEDVGAVPLLDPLPGGRQLAAA